MSEPSKAAFAFLDFKIVHFSFNELEDELTDISININPSGKYFKSEGTFEVSLDFVAFEDSNKENEFIKIRLKSFYRFDKPIEYNEIPPYFYLNSVAIAFPYLRAFISNLTLQANIKPLILPVLNLTGLDQPLRENTTVVE